MAETTSPMVELLAQFSRAATVRSLYPEAHPSVILACQDLLQCLKDTLVQRKSEEITLLIIESDVVVDEQPLRSHSLYLRPFVRLMQRFGIERLTLVRDLEQEECLSFLTSLVGSSVVESSRHIEIGHVTLLEGAVADLNINPGIATSLKLQDADIDRGGEAFLRMDQDRQGSLDTLDKLIWKVMSGMADTTQRLLLLGPIRNADEALFQHSLNVSTLVMAQGRSLGLEGAKLHEIGLAALLHDLGKTSLPKKVWAAGGRKDKKAWQYLRLHPELGAAMLSAEDNVPPLAVLVAYEHHLRWDGKPSYPRSIRRPNFASQITAVADTWDTFVAGPKQQDNSRQLLALRGLKARSGTLLDPFLVDNFITLMLDWRKKRKSKVLEVS